MSITIYHNPRCHKFRQTLALLEQRGLQPRIVEYLKTPPSLAELKGLLRQLDLSARELLRTREPEYQQLRLDNTALDDEVVLKAMMKCPKLIQRPIVLNGKKAVLGRPPENVLRIL